MPVVARLRMRLRKGTDSHVTNATMSLRIVSRKAGEGHWPSSWVASIAKSWTATEACAAREEFLLSIVLSIDPAIIGHPGSATTADHAVHQRFTDFLPDFLVHFGRLISVSSVVQLYSGP